MPALSLLSDTPMSSHRERLHQWFLLDGQTPSERIRQNLPQLAVLGLITWVSAAIVYRVASTILDPITGLLVLLVGGLYIGLKLREILIDSSDQS